MSYSRSSLWTDSVACSSGTRAAPTADTEGMDLSGVGSFRVIVSAVVGQTLNGVGNMQAWVYSPGLTRWCRDPTLDWAMTDPGVTWANVRDRAYCDLDVGARVGRALWAPSSIGTSSGEPVNQVEYWLAAGNT